MLLSAGLGRRRAFRRWQPSGSSSTSEPSLASDARTLAPKSFNSISACNQDGASVIGGVTHRRAT